MNANRPILCLNAGSSTLKFALFDEDRGNAVRLRGGLVEGARGTSRPDFRTAVGHILQKIARDLDAPLAAVGHRVVHGGAHYDRPVRIDQGVLAELRRTVHLAPAHQPGALAGIEAVLASNPGLPQVACFDTAFHHDLPPVAQRLPVPEAFHHDGLRRYGFHGLSYQHVREVLGDGIPERTVIAHLGNGCSMVALRSGHPVETTMGFTPNSGLMMGSRCGDLEVGALFHLLRTGSFDEASLDRFLHEDCGLRGVSGLSSDMRTLLEREAGHDGARQAIELFCHAARKHLGALVAVLGGLDLLVFTGGIGEHAGPIRERIAEPLRAFLIFEQQVVPTDEELVVARHTSQLCFPGR